MILSYILKEVNMMSSINTVCSRNCNMFMLSHTKIPVGQNGRRETNSGS
jgi:hypothetical protein